MKTKYGDDTVYRKVGNRYVPFGVHYAENYLPDGIWYVKHREYSYGTTSVPYIATMLHMGDSQKVDIPLMCGLEDTCNEITSSEGWKEMLHGERGVSFNDIVHYCVKYMYDKTNSENK